MVAPHLVGLRRRLTFACALSCELAFVSQWQYIRWFYAGGLEQEADESGMVALNVAEYSAVKQIKQVC